VVALGRGEACRPPLHPVIPRLLCRADGMLLSSTPPRCELLAVRSLEVVGAGHLSGSLWEAFAADRVAVSVCCTSRLPCGSLVPGPLLGPRTSQSNSPPLVAGRGWRDANTYDGI